MTGSIHVGSLLLTALDIARSLEILDISTAVHTRITEPVHEKTNNLGFQPGLTQTGLDKHKRWLEAEKFGFRK